MKSIPKQAKKICKNRGSSRPPLYISLKRRKTLGKSGVSSPAKWEVYGKQRWGDDEKSDKPGEAQC